MVKIAVIPPARNFELMGLGDLLMVLPNLCNLSKDYREYVKASTKYKILDNGAAEGAQETTEILLKLAKDLKIDEIIAPDVLYNADQTILATNKFLAKCPSRFRIMAVPQGLKLTEWLKCYSAFDSNDAIDVIGLSKFSVPKCFKEITLEDDIFTNRYEAMRRVYTKDKPVHLLGLRNPLELKYIQNARSCDTCLPILSVYLSMEMDNMEGVNTPDMYFRTEKLSDGQIEMAEQNIRRLKQCCS